MKYVKIAFTSGLSGIGYQEIDGSGIARITDEDGITIPADEVNENHVIDPNPIMPSWGTADDISQLGGQ